MKKGTLYCCFFVCEFKFTEILQMMSSLKKCQLTSVSLFNKKSMHS